MGATSSSGPSSESEAERIKAVFQKYDLNNDGFINQDELWQVLSRLSPKLTKDEVGQLFAKMDTNKDQRIQSSEFVDFIFSFADMGNVAEMKMREATASMDQAPEEHAQYTASSQNGSLNEPDLRLQKTDTTMSTSAITLQIGVRMVCEKTMERERESANHSFQQSPLNTAQGPILSPESKIFELVNALTWCLMFGLPSPPPLSQFLAYPSMMEPSRSQGPQIARESDNSASPRGDEPDLPDLLASLKAMNAQALREAPEGFVLPTGGIHAADLATQSGTAGNNGFANAHNGSG
eukprot:Skav214007  [mRNA]  locus=scaffold1070:299612:304224:- [translate_table: standard]